MSDCKQSNCKDFDSNGRCEKCKKVTYIAVINFMGHSKRLCLSCCAMIDRIHESNPNQHIT